MDPDPVGGEHRMDREAVGGSRFRELEAARPAVGRVGHARQRVQVHRSSRRPGQGTDELAVLVVVTDEEAARDELDGTAAELGEHACQGDELALVCVVRRNSAAVVRDVQLQL